MAMSSIQTQSPSLTGTGFAPVKFLTSRISRALAWNRVYRSTVNELAVLSNRELADISITRGEIRGIATRAADDAVATLAK